MPEEKVVESTPEKSSKDATTKAVEPSTKVSNADVRALAEESLDENNLTGSVEEDGDESEPLSESSTDETTDNEPSDEDDSDEDSEEADGTEVDDDLGDLLDETPAEETEEVKKSGLEKRIDKLTRLSYDKDAKIAALQKQISEKSTETAVKGKAKYTNAQLVTALEKARAEDNTELEIQIMQHISDSKAEAVKEEYEAKEKSQQAANQKMQDDWIAITDMFHYDEVEMYPGSQVELNIKDNKSLIYRLSAELYQNQGFKDESNGMSKAVSEALKRILAKKRNSAKPQKSSNEKNLEKKVKKLKRKTSSPSGSKTVKADPPKKVSGIKSDADKVSEAISEKKALTAWKY
jgi:hypothetical protein